MTTVPARALTPVNRMGALGRLIRAELDILGSMVVEQLAVDRPRREDLAIEAHCHDLLTTLDPPLAGAGAVTAPHLLTDAAYWLEWWTSDGKRPAPRISRLAAELDPRAIGFRDYTELGWYEKPFASGEPAVTGPYVDYLCTDQYTVTFTQPFLLGGKFGGVVGLDILVADFEDYVLSGCRAQDRVVVVNGMDRVVCSTDPAWVTGDLLPGHGDLRVTACPDLPFLTLTGP
ncbi:MAG: cache domain-containing protein [Intrasporangium sp.]|uniref:cache domain-containing protein n=1 Tax=Intrasporangium sp. TaxID=1925024 RepID=UPI003F8188AB